MAMSYQAMTIISGVVFLLGVAFVWWRSRRR